ncbi:MAG TPA: hypothetical protein VHC97_26690 [Thermoanaerobaculia bacterium]|jgi:hypothetical protein|nr:hypothetical protein [Thermoanaerobaculia bacterium]
MEWMTVEIQDGADAFLPGETVEGTASWQLDAPAETAELRLFWYTQGKGDQDVGVVSAFPFPDPALQDRRAFRVRLPEGPYSFSGKLISLAWALELVVEPGSRASRTEITVSPTRQEILIATGAAG